MENRSLFHHFFLLFITLIREISIIMGIYILGELTVHLLNTKFPGSVVGMLYLLGALHLKWVSVEQISHTASFLLSYMPMFFIPAGVSIMVSYKFMDGFYWQIIVIVLLSTLLTMGFSGKLTEYFLKRK